MKPEKINGSYKREDVDSYVNELKKKLELNIPESEWFDIYKEIKYFRDAPTF